MERIVKVVNIDEKFKKARIKGAKDIRKRKRRSRGRRYAFAREKGFGHEVAKEYERNPRKVISPQLDASGEPIKGSWMMRSLYKATKPFKPRIGTSPLGKSSIQDVQDKVIEKAERMRELRRKLAKELRRHTEVGIRGKERPLKELRAKLKKEIKKHPETHGHPEEEWTRVRAGKVETVHRRKPMVTYGKYKGRFPIRRKIGG